ncbi:MAG: dipeptidase [Cyanobacteria bacterium P01_E01_bin.45]
MSDRKRTVTPTKYRSRRSRWLRGAIATIVAAAIGIFAIGLPIMASSTEQRLNRVAFPPPYAISSDIAAVQEQLTVVDLHADPLLWNRDLLATNSVGHVDLPRLQSANVALQVFGVVTQVPQGLNIDRNRADTDILQYLAITQNWPPNTWFSPLQRALYQARKLQRFADRSNGQLRIIKTAEELEQLLRDRQDNPNVVGALLALEGAQALEGNIANLDRLYDAGFRMLGLSHFVDTDIGGSAHGWQKGGLTELGQQVVSRAQELGMAIDLAHASDILFDDVLTLNSGPVLVSHTGVDGTCDSTRNLSDAQLQAIADRGGVVGIGLFPSAVCGTTVEDTAAAIAYVANTVGVEHAALGSDFDGATVTSVDASGLPLLTKALLERGFSLDEVSRVMGRNALAELRDSLAQVR